MLNSSFIQSDRGRRWYAVQTRPRGEEIALRHLANQRFTTFCPRVRRTRRIGRHSVTGLDALFPGYIFVRLDLERQSWRAINGTIGVLRLVGFGDSGQIRPAPLPKGLVEHLSTLSSEDGCVQFREELRIGQAVRVIGGPFDQLCGRLEAASDLERTTILLEVLSKGTRVTLPRAMLVAA